MNTTEYSKLKLVLEQRLLGMADVSPRYFVVIEALRYAEKIHSGTRKDGVTPEFYHQLSILGRAMSMHPLLIDPASVYVAILLHDAPEDYKEIIHDLIVKFPEDSHNALALSKYRFKHRYGTTFDTEAKVYQDYMDELAQSPVLSVVKLLDRLHNLSTMPGVFNKDKMLRYIKEVDEYFMLMLKQAKRLHPKQSNAYELIKSDLNLMTNTLKHFLTAAS